jgi:hypothetical protein
MSDSANIQSERGFQRNEKPEKQRFFVSFRFGGPNRTIT